MQLTNPSAATDNCRYCLMCRHVCPVGHVTHLESLTPHGWGLTIASVQRGLLTWNTETVGALYHCADCGACRANCVTDQPLPDAIAAARATVTAEGLAPASVYRVGELLTTWGNPYGQAAPAPTTVRGDVALFVGDDAHLPGPVWSTRSSSCSAAGIEPVLVGRGRNNGYLASSLGFPATARTLAQATLDEVAATGARRLLVLTPGDLFTFRQLYDERLGIAWPAEVALVDVVTLLAELLDAGKLAFRRLAESEPYAYLDPTHTVRVPERADAPRRLLSAVLPGAWRESFSGAATHPSHRRHGAAVHAAAHGHAAGQRPPGRCAQKRRPAAHHRSRGRPGAARTAGAAPGAAAAGVVRAAGGPGDVTADQLNLQSPISNLRRLKIEIRRLRLEICDSFWMFNHSQTRRRELCTCLCTTGCARSRSR
jgi:Fe-S oxidoreductase